MDVVCILHGIYLIDRGGRNILSMTFSEWFDERGIDPDEFSGLLSALKMFTGEITKGLGELKIIDMDIIYILPIVKKNVLIIGIADKYDERYLIYHFLENLLDSFNDVYNSQGELENWDGSKNKFKKFEDTLNNVRGNATFAEMKKVKPILKIYKKFDKKPDVMEKKLPKSVLTQGVITQKEYEIAHLMKGRLVIEDIAKKHGIPLSQLQYTIKKLDNLGLIKFIE